MSAPIMQYFEYSHLPVHLQEVSKPIGKLAELMDETLLDGPEKSVGLRKLLEAKDALVRARLEDNTKVENRVTAVAKAQDLDIANQQQLHDRRFSTVSDLPSCFQELFRHARGLSFGKDWNNGMAANQHRSALETAIANCEQFYRLSKGRDKTATAPTNSGKLTFGEALFFLKQGKKVARSGWNGKGMFLFLVPGSEFKVNRAPLLDIYPEGYRVKYHAHIDMKTADDTIVPWLCSQTDALAEDWCVVD
jgi:hypothetical protein